MAEAWKVIAPLGVGMALGGLMLWLIDIGGRVCRRIRYLRWLAEVNARNQRAE